MPINRQLLEVLVCPVTKLPVRMLDESRLEQINQLIGQGEIQNAGGETVGEPLVEALVTSNDNTVYRVDQGIPVMLEDQSIPTHQIEDF